MVYFNDKQEVKNSSHRGNDVTDEVPEGDTGTFQIFDVLMALQPLVNSVAALRPFRISL